MCLLNQVCSLRTNLASPRSPKSPRRMSGQGLTPGSILRNDDDIVDLSSDEDIDDDALEMLIKSKQEAEIFNDLPLFDADILNNFIDEWFEETSLTLDDLQLPIGISVTFQ